jgi:AraC-like DNA-binding protein/quercetin dioxygenase-like cupin family protein
MGGFAPHGDTMSGATVANWVVRAPGTLDRFDVLLHGAAFAPHRHDTYAICITLAGVQSFTYRGARRYSLPGQMVVLHPDEVHDGGAGGDGAFRYRVLYLEPAVLQLMLGGRPLPFVDGGVTADPRLKRALWPLLADPTRPLAELERDDALAKLALTLCAIADADARPASFDYGAAQLARAYMDAHLDCDVTLANLEAAAGRDRWRLSRDFRAVFGTSPYRYLLLRRLDSARALLVSGHTIADAALACGFADQSHFTRRHKQAFGMTPNVWLSAMRRGRQLRTIVQYRGSGPA